MRGVLLFSLWAIVCPFALFGQSASYYPIFTSKTQWNLAVLNYANNAIVTAVQKTTKDTMMSGEKYMVFAPDANTPNRDNVFMSEDPLTQKVYVVENNETHLLYDFSLKKGDLFKFKDLDFKVIDVSSVTTNEGKRRRIELKCLTKLADFLVWIEGVGSTISPLYYKHYASTTHDVKVTCFFREQTFVYGLSDEPCALPVSLNERNQHHLTIGVSPNPFSSDLKINVKNLENEAITLQLFSITGVQLYSERFNNSPQDLLLDMNFSDLSSGIYLLHLRSGSSSTTTRIVKQ